MDGVCALSLGDHVCFLSRRLRLANNMLVDSRVSGSSGVARVDASMVRMVERMCGLSASEEVFAVACPYRSNAVSGSEECGSPGLGPINDQFVLPIWQSEVIGYPLSLPECDAGNGRPTAWYDEFPQGASSSSGAVAIRDCDCLAVGTCDVGSCQSVSPASSDSNDYLPALDLVWDKCWLARRNLQFRDYIGSQRRLINLDRFPRPMVMRRSSSIGLVPQVNVVPSPYVPRRAVVQVHGLGGGVMILCVCITPGLA